MLNILYAENDGEREQRDDRRPEPEICVPDIWQVVYLQDGLRKGGKAQEGKNGLVSKSAYDAGRDLVRDALTIFA